MTACLDSRSWRSSADRGPAREGSLRPVPTNRAREGNLTPPVARAWRAGRRPHIESQRVERWVRMGTEVRLPRDPGSPGEPLSAIEINRERPTLAIIVPCFNEFEALDQHPEDPPGVPSRSRGPRSLSRTRASSTVSTTAVATRTWEKLVEAHRNAPRKVKGAKLAANVGHQRALLAGMLAVGPRTDCVITIDADLQDDVGVIPDMLAAYREGCEIVYGVRRRPHRPTRRSSGGRRSDSTR